jgi:hypothetical protein
VQRGDEDDRYEPERPHRPREPANVDGEEATHGIVVDEQDSRKPVLLLTLDPLPGYYADDAIIVAVVLSQLGDEVEKYRWWRGVS